MRNLAFAVLASAIVAGCSSSTPKTAEPQQPTAQSTAMHAQANLASASGSLVSGRVEFDPMGDGVHLTGTIGGLQPNSVHGIHVHEKGDCSAADASSAGGHFNPAGSAHGRASSTTHHAGDMDNITAGADGTAAISIHLAGVTLGGGAANDIANRALVVHAAADDYTTQPSGNSGARVACGVIRITQ
ncbi:superoxide dismutase family protein [Lysobacter sp. KIS68-7]|uniref:superoxide dismutase family protein n=1 Tax=Lysobacter sp. KIS68-7 TaxID=2904252 RepID=UPI001E3405AF|nr:superoxide dismutase family protein [Lysobacter sp. KIS68-7]UHQ20497.1 superoxide dismutase family protein [Lysobacter sp. KIS68-7]